MAWPEFQIEENSRCKLAIAAGVLNVLLILPCAALLFTGVYVQIAVQEKIKLIEGFNGDILPGFMMTSGILGVLTCILGSKICWTCQYPGEKRIMWAKYLLPYVIVEIVMSLLVFIAAIMCFAQISSLENSFENGIANALQQYRHGGEIKIELDNLQMQYKCCGSISYTDWFSIQWIHDDYFSISKKKALEETQSFNDVPFSCCRSDILRPCIHHHVHDNKAHHNYDYRTKVHVHTKGCRDALMSFYGDELLTNVGILVLVISFIQILVTISSRILQTAIDTSLDNEDDTAPSKAYICPCGSTAIEALKQGAKKYHKTALKKSDKSATMPLLDGYGEELEMEAVPIVEHKAQPKSVNTDDISVTDSFDSDFEDGAAGNYETPHFPEEKAIAEEHIYDSINSRHSSRSLNLPPFPPPPCPPEAVQMDINEDRYIPFPCPPPPGPQMQQSQQGIPVRGAPLYVNQMAFPNQEYGY